MTLWSWDLAFFKDLIEQLPILCSIYILCRSSQDLHTHFGKGFCQLNGCLTAKLYHSSIRFFNVYHILHIFRSQRFKIQLICNIKVSTYCFRIIVDNDGLIAFFCKCPCTMYRAEVKLNTLANTDRTVNQEQGFSFLSGVATASFSVPAHLHTRNNNMVFLLQTPLHRYQPSYKLHGCHIPARSCFDLCLCLSCKIGQRYSLEIPVRFASSRSSFVSFLALQGLSPYSTRIASLSINQISIWVIS